MHTHAAKTQNSSHQAIGSGNSGSSAIFSDLRPQAVVQRKQQQMADAFVQSKQLPFQRKANDTGLPDQLKSGIESLSGYAMDDVEVHYNSAKPAQLNAHAYAQGTEIHLAPGHEQHLPHEAWHVVQQKQGRVQPTKQLKGKAAINDDPGLEREATAMGAKALYQSSPAVQRKEQTAGSENIIQAYSTDVSGRKVSEHNQYRIDPRATDELQVAPGAPGPEPAARFRHARTLADGYRVYVLKGGQRSYKNECLDFAEYLSRGKYDTAPEFRAKGDGGGSKKDRLFGHSTNQNLDISSEARHPGGKRKSSFSQGNNANPGVGEAYAIVRAEEEDDECPFHIAFVVAQDGADNITCEADASDRRRKKPVFDMYATPKPVNVGGIIAMTVAPGNETFHDTFKSIYETSKKSKIEPVTGILEAK